MAIYLGVSLPQVHYQDWNVKTFLYQSTLVLPGMPQLAVLKLLLSFISNGSGNNYVVFLYLCIIKIIFQGQTMSIKNI